MFQINEIEIRTMKMLTYPVSKILWIEIGKNGFSVSYLLNFDLSLITNSIYCIIDQ